MPKIQDTLVLNLSDLHCNSPVGLIRPGQWQLRSGNFTPRKLQRLIWQQYAEVAERTAKLRKSRRLVIVFNGDLVEGYHHDSPEYISSYEQDQEEIAEDALEYLFKKTHPDAVYIVDGTPAHSGESESRIAKDLKQWNIVKNGSRWTWPVLYLDINGKLLYYAHEGPQGGDGPNAGNSLRNALRIIRYNCLDNGAPVPDFVVYSHYHSKTDESFRGTQGFILASFQAKTSFTFRAVPHVFTNIGGHYILINADGSTAWDWICAQVQQVKVERL